MRNNTSISFYIKKGNKIIPLIPLRVSILITHYPIIINDVIIMIIVIIIPITTLTRRLYYVDFVIIANDRQIFSEHIEIIQRVILLF